MSFKVHVYWRTGGGGSNTSCPQSSITTSTDVSYAFTELSRTVKNVMSKSHVVLPLIPVTVVARGYMNALCMCVLGGYLNTEITLMERCLIRSHYMLLSANDKCITHNRLIETPVHVMLFVDIQMVSLIPFWRKCGFGFSLTICNEGAYFTFKSIYHTVLNLF